MAQSKSYLTDRRMDKADEWPYRMADSDVSEIQQGVEGGGGMVLIIYLTDQCVAIGRPRMASYKQELLQSIVYTSKDYGSILVSNTWRRDNVSYPSGCCFHVVCLLG